MRANYFFIPDFGSFSANFNLLCSVYNVVIVCRHRLVGSLFQHPRDRVRLLSSHRRPSDVGCCKHCQQVDAAHKLYSAPTRSINSSALSLDRPILFPCLSRSFDVVSLTVQHLYPLQRPYISSLPQDAFARYLNSTSQPRYSSNYSSFHSPSASQLCRHSPHSHHI